MVSVREAVAADWDAVTALLAELGRPDVTGKSEHFEEFTRYLARNDALALVAEVGGVIVGFCDVEFRQRLNFPNPEGWIPDLIVSEAARSSGVGSALLAEAERHSRARGCFALSLESANWRERAHSFYLREGMTAVGRVFTKGFGSETWPPAPPGD